MFKSNPLINKDKKTTGNYKLSAKKLKNTIKEDKIRILNPQIIILKNLFNPSELHEPYRCILLNM